MRYAVFFRGINVGGHNIVKMADLRQLLTGCGLEHVQTYIQSGNVVLTSQHSQQKLTQVITRAFENHYGFLCDFAIRSAAEMAAILSGLPFTEQEVKQAESKNPDVEHVYVYLSNLPIPAAELSALQAARQADDRLVAHERELYLLCQGSIRKSKAAIALAKLQLPLTTRNWRTMHKVNAMLKTGS